MHPFPGVAGINLGNFRFADILGADDISYINPLGINHNANKTQTSIIISHSSKSQRKGTEEKSSSGGFERLEESDNGAISSQSSGQQQVVTHQFIEDEQYVQNQGGLSID